MVCCRDLATGSQLAQYKTNSCGRNRFCSVGPDYFVAAQNGKDSIHFWTWHKDQVHQRSFAQESLTALAASPNGAYLAAGGNSGTIYVWDTASGALLRSWPAHYKAVSCLVFSDSGGVLVSCGEDTLVCAWLLTEVLDTQRDHQAAAAAAAMSTARVEPLHTWSEHTLPVTCLCLGMSEGSAVLATASLDRSIKLWSLATGQLLRSITLPAGVTSVTMDAGEHVLLAGCADGSIYEASLVGAQQQQQGVMRGAAAAAAAAAGGGSSGSSSVVGGPGSCCYEGHVKAVSSLCITHDGEQLVSGCEDGTARVWDLRSRQCLRVITAPNKAPVSGVLLVEAAAKLAGQSSSSSSSKQGPKRLQPLAQLAKYAGASTAAKPWEGPTMVLDASSCGHSSSSSWHQAGSAVAAAGMMPAGLWLQPCQDPLELLQLTPAEGSTAAAVGAAAATGGGADVPQAGGAAGAAAEASGEQAEVVRLRQQVVQLQQQLQETQQVAQQWQSLHGQLHQFCTEQVLAAP